MSSIGSMEKSDSLLVHAVALDSRIWEYSEAGEVEPQESRQAGYLPGGSLPSINTAGMAPVLFSSRVALGLHENILFMTRPSTVFLLQE
tara:strand:- start:473 stop:739 length:267 start_codon:yes stop_codon:yes gene_type:complete